MPRRQKEATTAVKGSSSPKSSISFQPFEKQKYTQTLNPFQENAEKGAIFEDENLHLRPNSRCGKKQSYREIIKRICIRCEYEPVDPWQREKIIYRGVEHGWWEKVPASDFIKRDLEDIDKCDVLIAYMPKLSAGTCMELFYAKMKGKKTICICKIRNPSPWITMHSDIILKEVKELELALKTIKTH